MPSPNKSARQADPAPDSSYHYTERTPSALLQPWFLALWSFVADAQSPTSIPYTVWPDGCVSVVLVPDLDRTDIVCIGPRVTAWYPPIVAGRRIWGVRFWPDALEALTGIAAPTLRDFIGPAPDALASWSTALVEAGISDAPASQGFDRLDAALARSVMHAMPTDPAVRKAIITITASRGVAPLTDVARESGLGLRQLQRRFPSRTGLTLREFARLRRLRTSLAHRLENQSQGWARVAAETGFADHAHLTREFIALTHTAPRDVARLLRETRHTDVRP